ncbi:MAG TPA: thiolase family protein [Nitrososphaeraceae archaeon]
MSEIAIVSSKSGEFKKNSTRSLLEIACEPCLSIFKEAPHLRDEINCVLFSTTSGVQYGSTILSEYLGIRSTVSQTIENLCNSGTNAIISAYSFIKSGLCDTVLVVGADRRDTAGKTLKWDVTRGQFPFPVHWAALFAKAHMRKYHTTEEQMAMVAVKNRGNALKNPNSIFNTNITINDVLESKKIAEPIKILDCSYVCDGAAAVVMTSSKNVNKFTDDPVWVKGIGTHTESASFALTGQDLCSINSAQIAARKAYRMAKIKPNEVKVVELHDAFTIMEIMAYEDLLLVSKGEGGKFVLQDEICINPRGGLLGSGHPIGATGVAQVAEVTEQLSGMAGKRQTKISGEVGMVHNLAAAGSSAAVLILKK